MLLPFWMVFFMAKGWNQIYPKDCYRVLLVISGKTGVSFPKAVNIILREGLIHSPNLLGEWKLPQSTTQAHLLKPTPLQQPGPLTKEMLEKRQELEEWETRFSNILKQWDKVPEKSQKFHIKKARELKEVVSNAKYILALANGETVPLEATGKGAPSNE